MQPKPVAFVDLGAQHQEIAAELEAAWRRTIGTSSFVGGPAVEGFERAFLDYLGVEHVVGVSSGTDAVRIALRIAGVQRGDAVVTVSHTFIGTTEGVEHLGAVPLFVDIDRGSRTMSPSALASFLEGACARDAHGVLRHQESGRRIGAVLPVHLYGQSADMAPILASAEEYGIPVVEDAAQAHGATYRFPGGREVMCGAMGRSAAFSFYPGKNLGAMGEAGAVITADGEGAEQARLLRDHGQVRKYVHDVPDAGNARLDALQAEVLRIKLERLDAWNEARRQAAAGYLARLEEAAGLDLPREQAYGRHVYHLFVVHVEERDHVRGELERHGISCGLHYPVPLHLQPAYTGAAVVGGTLHETEWAAERCLSLPMHPHLTEAELDRVAEVLTGCLRPVGRARSV